MMFFAMINHGLVKSQIVVSAEKPAVATMHESDKRLPGYQFEWTQDRLPDAPGLAAEQKHHQLMIQEESPAPFTGLAIGWKVEGEKPDADAFHLRIRSRDARVRWPEWVRTRGYLNPEDSPSGLYWAMLYVTPDGSAHREFEVEISTPAGTAVSYLKISAADARFETDPEQLEKFMFESKEAELPDIITRTGWWGNLPPDELEPDYNPMQIDITHSAVHHTVTANEPPDPPQVIRQIWDWHVNDNGWLDIGYNFLIDHTGNIYQGRYNPWLESTDVQGAHAGRANSRSVGIALLGQFEPGANPTPGEPAAATLNSLVEMISWRFDQKGIDPLGQTSIPVNPSGSRVLPHILGHRDVSATACPGENLYTLLPQLRNDVATGLPVDDAVAAGPFELRQNYPNPFRIRTTIPFRLDEDLYVRIELYTVTGNHVRRIYEGELEEGEHDLQVDLNGLSSGVYFYELVAGRFSQARKMVFFR